MDSLVHSRPASLLWLPLRFLSIADIVAVSATSKAVRAASNENALWFALLSARWGIHRRRWSEDEPGCWLRQYREWHRCGRLPTGFLSGVSDTVLALSVQSSIAVWLCTPRGGDTRLSRGVLRFPIGTTGAKFTLPVLGNAPPSMAVPPSTPSPPASMSLATSCLDDVSSRPAGDSVEQYLLLKLVVQNLAEAALLVAASGVTLVLRSTGSAGEMSDGGMVRPADPTGARIPAMIPVGHCAVVAVNGVAAPGQADAVVVAAGGSAVLRVAFSAPAWCASSAAAMSEPNALEHVAAVELCMSKSSVATGDSAAAGALLTRLAVHDTWRHYRAAGRGLFVRVEPEEPS